MLALGGPRLNCGSTIMVNSSKHRDDSHLSPTSLSTTMDPESKSHSLSEAVTPGDVLHGGNSNQPEDLLDHIDGESSGDIDKSSLVLNRIPQAKARSSDRSEQRYDENGRRLVAGCVAFFRGPITPAV